MPSSPSLPAFNPNNTIGAALLGGFACAILYGITSLQSFYFFQHCSRQTVWTKASVWILWSINSVHLAFIIHPLYWYIVVNYDQPLALVDITWSINAGIILTAFNDVLVRTWLLYRIWILSSKSRVLTLPLLVFVWTLFAIALAMGARAFESKTLARFIKDEWVVETDLSMVFVSDVLIASCLCLLLACHRRRTVNRKTESYMTVLILYTVNTGLLTSMVALACLISFVTMPDNFIFIAIFFPMANLYANSLLASFNMRDSLRPEDKTTVTLPLSSLSASRSSRGRAQPGEAGDMVIHINTEDSKGVI